MAFGDFARQDDYSVDPLTGAPFAPSGEAQGKFGRIVDAVISGLRNWVETPGRAYKEGIDREEAADWGAGTAFGMIAGSKLPGGAAGSGMTKLPGIKAYHGSPHDFDRFDLSKIGTGEGAQAYGHGLYFAENKAVAQDYKTSLSKNRPWEFEGKPIGPDTPYTVRNALEWLKSSNRPDESVADLIARRVKDLSEHGDFMRSASNPADRQAASIYDHAVRDLLSLDPAKIKPPTGKMYEVNLNARPEQFLDWDRPLSQQPQAAREILALPPQASRLNETMIAKGHPEMTGGQAFAEVRAASPDKSQALLSSKLHEAGLPGIKYFDQFSRSHDAGSRNYVVFDPGIIDILRKYGLVGAGATGFGTLAAQDNYRKD